MQSEAGSSEQRIGHIKRWACASLPRLNILDSLNTYPIDPKLHPSTNEEEVWSYARDAQIPQSTATADVIQRRWGIIGTAGIAKKNARAICDSGHGLLVAVGSRDIDRAVEFVKSINQANNNDENHESKKKIKLDTNVKVIKGVKCYGSYEDLLNDKDNLQLDSVYIPLPTIMHFEWVIKAAARGLNVLLEKPVAISTHELLTMVAMCDHRNVIYMDGTMFMHNRRTAEIMKIIRTKIDQAKFPIAIQSTFNFSGGDDFIKGGNIRTNGMDPFGCLGDLAWYCIRYSMCLTGFSPPKRVRCIKMTTNDIGVPIHCEGEIDWDRDIRLTFQSSFLLDLQQRVEISFPDCCLKIDDAVICDPFENAFFVERNTFVDNDRLYKPTRTKINCNEDLPESQEASMFDTFAIESLFFESLKDHAKDSTAVNRKSDGVDGYGERMHFWSYISVLNQLCVSAVYDSYFNHYEWQDIGKKLLPVVNIYDELRDNIMSDNNFTFENSNIVEKILMIPERNCKTYSLWLTPGEETDVYRVLKYIIENLSNEYSAIPFLPHVTLASFTSSDLKRAFETSSFIAKSSALHNICCINENISYGDKYFQCLYISIVPTKEITRANKFARTILTLREHKVSLANPDYMPHCSLLYSNISINERETLKSRMYSNDLPTSMVTPTRFFPSELQLWETDTTDMEMKTWKKLASYPLRTHST